MFTDKIPLVRYKSSICIHLAQQAKAFINVNLLQDL